MTPLEQVIHDSQKLRPRTKEIYLHAVESFLAAVGPQRSGWTPTAVERWHRARARATTAQSANLELAGLRYAAKRLAAIQMNPQANFAGPVEMLRVEHKKRRRAIALEQAQAVLATCDSGSPVDLRDRAILMLGFRAGMRRQAILGIRFSDLTGNRVTITLKGGKRHNVWLDPEAAQALGAWIGWLGEAGVSSGSVFRALTTPTIEGTVRVRRHPISLTMVFLMVQARGRAVGLKISPHTMRHSCVSWLVDQGVPPHRIRALTGHRSNTMIDHYTHDLAAASDPLGNHLPSLVR